MPILPKKTENRLPISTDVLINGIALTITRCTFQEYKMKYNITSDEFDDLDKGYECVYNPYHIILWLLICLICEVQMLRSLPLLHPYWGLQSFTKCY